MLGPGAHVNANESFVSFRALLLATDSAEIERSTLARHRLAQLLAPHVTENPIFFHATDVSDAGFRNAIDQMAEVGFEMLIFSFGSGFRLETSDAAYLATIKAQVAYAKSKGSRSAATTSSASTAATAGRRQRRRSMVCGRRGDGRAHGGRVLRLWMVRQALRPRRPLYQRDGPRDARDRRPVRRTPMRVDQPRPPPRPRGFHLPAEPAAEQVLHRDAAATCTSTSRTTFLPGWQPDGDGLRRESVPLPRWLDLSISARAYTTTSTRCCRRKGGCSSPVGLPRGGAMATFAGHQQAYEFALATYLGAGTAACYRGPTLYGDGPAGEAIRRSSGGGSPSTKLTGAP